MEAPAPPEQRIRLQVELAGDTNRIWVAVFPSASIAELCGVIEQQYLKVRGKYVTVVEVTLRGAILDTEERVGFWLRDQELLYASWRERADVEGGVVRTPPPAHVPQRPAVGPPKPPPPNVQASVTQTQKAPLMVAESTASGVVVCHQVPTHLVMTLKELAPQSLALVVIGAKGVGKSSFIRSFIDAVDATAPENAHRVLAPPEPISEKKVEVDGVHHTVTVFDTTHATVADPSRGFFSKADAFVFVFDVSNRSSFDVLSKSLLGLMVASRGHDPAVPVTILANKIDVQPRVVSARETLALAQELSTLIKGSVALFECSALRGTHVLDAVQDTFLNLLYWRACAESNRAPGGYCVVQ